jgi:hypothetical protein
MTAVLGSIRAKVKQSLGERLISTHEALRDARWRDDALRILNGVGAAVTRLFFV